VHVGAPVDRIRSDGDGHSGQEGHVAQRRGTRSRGGEVGPTQSAPPLAGSDLKTSLYGRAIGPRGSAIDPLVDAVLASEKRFRNISFESDDVEEDAAPARPSGERKVSAGQRCASSLSDDRATATAPGARGSSPYPTSWPAVPPELFKGSGAGIVSRPGIEVSIEWAPDTAGEITLTEATFSAVRAPAATRGTGSRGMAARSQSTSRDSIRSRFAEVTSQAEPGLDPAPLASAASHGSWRANWWPAPPSCSLNS
jgi:hypothetical protein